MARSITDDQDPNALLRRAISLSSVGTSQAPLEGQLAGAQQVLDAQSVAADRARAAAAHATDLAGRAEATARQAAASAADLEGALREAALRLYTGGEDAVVPADPGATADDLTDAAAYEDSLLSPDGILAQRKVVAAIARHAAADKAKEQAAAVRDEARATTALGVAGAADAQIRNQLAVLGAADATLVSSERTAMSVQAGQSLASPSALDFAPAAPLPAPLPTTSVALAWAFSELGKPYVWGGTGPDVFDCSGLTQYSWAHAGVQIPRVAADQDAWTVPVPLSQLLPGDLVFFGTTDIHHVGMYIGDGLMINAPHTGDVVRISSIWWSDLAGFGRVHAAGVPVPARVLPGATNPAAPAVLPAPGDVPSESAPPPGYVAPPGATFPVAPPAPGLSPTTRPGTGLGTGLGTGPGSGFGTGLGSAPTRTTTTTTVPPAPTTTTTTLPGATTTTPPPSTTTTTTLPLPGLGG